MKLDKMITLDIECYPNYLLVMFKQVVGDKVIYFEKFNNSDLHTKNIFHILSKYTIVTFNGNKYDACILEAAVAGFSNETIHRISEFLIVEKQQPWQARKQFGFTALDMDHIDLIEVAPLSASLKIYGGRMHTRTLQDLPIEPGTIIEAEDLPGMRHYCENDNNLTAELLEKLNSELDLRESMSSEYNVDLRSKSDAQIAEQVIKKELDDKYDIRVTRPKVEESTRYRYIPPDNLVFETEILKDLFRQYTTRPFSVGKSGHIAFDFEMCESDRIKSGKNKGKMPEKKQKLKFMISGTKYTVGVGGLHSNEKSVRHTNEHDILREYDVESFYPRIVLNNELAPRHIGSPFLKIYKSIVERRLNSKVLQKAAKKKGDEKEESFHKIINESLKITINGLFGKLGSKWSCFYSPDLMMQVTVTGQLSLLMLIEQMELAGISVVSANTDGIVVKMDPSLESTAEDIISTWEFDTDYKMEATNYESLNSRDVNAYIAIKENSVKGKGAYVDQLGAFEMLRHNPEHGVCSDAVKEFLRNGTPLETTVTECKDIRKFISIRTVNGGAIYEGELLGKAIRWYYGASELDCIRYNTNGNKVPKSDGAVPLMNLPAELPFDMDYQWYIDKSNEILKSIGYNK